ncbi:MAG TPA: hypothetical protein DCE55_28355, partial [Planctomycetaceae bacterium]|nr:hypothetical protein [Planctomycetaceae bacterium]
QQDPQADLVDTDSNSIQPTVETAELLEALEEAPNTRNLDPEHPADSHSSSQHDSSPNSITDAQPSQDTEETKQ